MDSLQNDTVTIEAYFPVSGEQLWKAWTDPDLILNWFGSDPDGRGLKAELDVRPGGSFEITFKDSDQTEHTCSGVYRDVKECSKLSFTWTWENEPGVESFVTVAMDSNNHLTRMLFQHARIGTVSGHDYLDGWKATFAKLERMLTGK